MYKIIMIYLDIVKVSQIPPMNSCSSNFRTDAFPWHNNSNNLCTEYAQNATDPSYQANLKTSTSAVSLSEFSSLWPSMNNLVNAAEALSSNQPKEFVLNPETNSGSPKFGENLCCNPLGSLSKLHSLSNVALDELEAMASSDFLQAQYKKSSKENNTKNVPDTDYINEQKIDYDVDYEMGYNIDETQSPKSNKVLISSDKVQSIEVKLENDKVFFTAF
jgi:hypothetical protein